MEAICHLPPCKQRISFAVLVFGTDLPMPAIQCLLCVNRTQSLKALFAVDALTDCLHLTAGCYKAVESLLRG